jgi:hypothetical protein
MPENYEKEVILSYEKLLPAEELLIREINVALRANIFSKS